MPIVRADIDAVELLRQRVLDRLARERRERATFTVLDVGGGANAWADSQVDAYVDIVPFATDRRLFLGDVCRPAVWDEIAQEVEHRGARYDFSICTHVLEDVRDPFFVARQLARVSAAGFVSMPTKHTELSHVDSTAYLGYCHHRWIYTVRDEPAEGVAGAASRQTLVAMAKLPIVDYFNRAGRPGRWLAHRLGRWSSGAKLARRLKLSPGGAGIDWLDQSRAGHHLELGVEWRDDLPFFALNDDYAGASCMELADLYRVHLARGL